MIHHATWCYWPQFNASRWAPPDGVVNLTMQAVSYIGANISNATMRASLGYSSANGTAIILNVTLTTNATGGATAVIDLGALPADKRPTLGAVASANVKWIGPTRERIVRTASVHIQDAEWRLELERSLDTSLPGVAFGTSVRVFSNENDTEVENVPIRCSAFILLPVSNCCRSCDRIPHADYLSVWGQIHCTKTVDIAQAMNAKLLL